MESNEIEFTIKCKMRKRWVDYFCSMLRMMEWFGNIGHSGEVKFYADGDGDFRPKFDFSIDYEKKNPRENGCFDAG